jgi:hypothetical protein
MADEVKIEDVIAQDVAATETPVVVDEPVVEELKAEEVQFENANGVQIVEHLDRDPNDPRNREDTPKLPSLNDEGQS